MRANHNNARRAVPARLTDLREPLPTATPLGDLPPRRADDPTGSCAPVPTATPPGAQTERRRHTPYLRPLPGSRRAATRVCWRGRGSTGARGRRTSRTRSETVVHKLLRAGTWTCSSGFENRAARGIRRRVITAAQGGHLDMLQWLRLHDCPWHASTCAYAALAGHLEALKWAWEHHCPWDERTCEGAAGGRHLEVMQWAREHHCPWDAPTRQAAEQAGHLELLQWAVEHGAP
jgi:hypothetical protein